MKRKLSNELVYSNIASELG